MMKPEDVTLNYLSPYVAGAALGLGAGWILGGRYDAPKESLLSLLGQAEHHLEQAVALYREAASRMEEPIEGPKRKPQSRKRKEKK